MAAFHGKQGQVTFAGGAVSNVISWSVDMTADVAVSAVMGYTAVAATTHWKEYLTGFRDWTATIECDFDNGGFDPDLATDFWDEDGVEVIFYAGTNAISAQKYTGNGVITGISPSVDLNDIIKITYTVQGSGALVEASVPA